MVQTPLSLDKKLIATVPLIQFVFGFVSSFGMELLAKKIGKVKSLLLGCLMMLTTNIVLGTTLTLSQTSIYSMAIIQGAATTIFVVQSLALIAEMVSNDEGSSGFVYGFTSFVEKILGSAVFMFIQYVIDSKNQNEELLADTCREVVSYGVGSVSVSVAFLAFIFQLLMDRVQQSEKDSNQIYSQTLLSSRNEQSNE